MKKRAQNLGDQYIRIGSKTYNVAELKKLYSEFADEDRELANTGLEEHANLLKMEDEKG
jgi:hypothetical protein